MAQTREIDKLQRRWQENPLGLTFAPLAEAYRKEGMFADALELLEIGLSQHPNYVPAHIVRGRCFLDIEQDDQAEASFGRVTELDPENAIALQGLAAIAERGGRLEDAIARLDRLLEFDRGNEEAQAQAERLRAELASRPPAAIPPAPIDPVNAASASEPPAPAAPGMSAAPVEPAPAVPSFAAESAAAAAAVALPGALAAAPRTEPPAALPTAPAVSTEELLDTWLGGEPEPLPAEPAKAEILPADAAVETFNPLDLVASPEPLYQRPSDADLLDSTQARGEGQPGPAIEPPPNVDPAPPEPAEADPMPVAAHPPDADELGTGEPGAVDEWIAELAPPAPNPAAPASAAEDDEPTADGLDPDGDAADLVVTESMAELFLRQGHQQLALAVYSQLLTRDPTNPRIRAHAERLDAELRPANTRTALPAYAAVLTGGQSVRSFCETLLAATRPGAGKPGSALSLGAVFGDERNPAEAAAARPAGGESFDEFFGDDAAAAAPDARTPEPAHHSADPVEDIEEFNSWLKGLKR